MNGGRRARQTELLLAAAIALGIAIWQFPSLGSTTNAPVSATGSAHGPTAGTIDDLAAPAQSALDRVLGAGHSVITASATYSAASVKRSTTYDPKHVAVLEQSQVTAPGYQGSVTDNKVSQTVTDARTSGRITRISVAVVVDSSLRPAPKLATIRRTVTAALGLRPRRGDTITVTRAPISAVSSTAASSTVSIAGTTRASAPVSGTASRISAFLPSGFAVGVVLVLLILAVCSTRRRSGTSRRSSSRSPR